MNKQDGFTTLIGGQNAGLRTHLLQPNQYSFGLNTSSRGGCVHTRPPFLPTGIDLGDRTHGKFQGACAYRLSSLDRIIFVIDGHVLGVDTTKFEVTDYSAMTDVGLLDANIDRCYFCQADHFMIIQDGINPAVIIQEGTARRADHTKKEIPLGTLMAYGHGRLFMVPVRVQNQDGRRFFLAGDIMLPQDPGNLLKFTETAELVGGGALALPAEMGIVQSMDFLQNAPTGSGVGALVVFGKHGVSSFDVNTPRAQWAEVDISHVLFKEDGTLSPNSIVTVNSDMYYRGKDGIRTIGATVNEIAKGSWGNKTYGIRNSPISREVDTILNRDDAQTVLPFVEMAVCGNRLFCTTVIDTEKTEPMFKAVVVLDADVVSSITTPSPPIWDGAWTGHNFMSLVIARNPAREKNALYTFVKTDLGENDLLRLSGDEGYVAGESEKIKCRIYTKGYHLDDLVSQKQFLRMNLILSDIRGTTTMKAYYKPIGYPFWANMDNGFIQTGVVGFGHRRQNIIMSPTGKEFDPVLQTLLQFAWGFDFCLQWEGHLEIDSASFLIDIKPEPPQMACQMLPAGSEVTAESGLDLDPFGPWSIEDQFIPVEEFEWVSRNLFWERGEFNPVFMGDTSLEWVVYPVYEDKTLEEYLGDLPLHDEQEHDYGEPPAAAAPFPSVPEEPFAFATIKWSSDDVLQQSYSGRFEYVQGPFFNGAQTELPEDQFVDICIISNSEDVSVAYELDESTIPRELIANAIELSEYSRTQFVGPDIAKELNWRDDDGKYMVVQGIILTVVCVRVHFTSELDNIQMNYPGAAEKFTIMVKETKATRGTHTARHRYDQNDTTSPKLDGEIAVAIGSFEVFYEGLKKMEILIGEGPWPNWETEATEEQKEAYEQRFMRYESGKIMSWDSPWHEYRMFRGDEYNVTKHISSHTVVPTTVLFFYSPAQEYDPADLIRYPKRYHDMIDRNKLPKIMVIAEYSDTDVFTEITGTPPDYKWYDFTIKWKINPETYMHEQDRFWFGPSTEIGVKRWQPITS